jgi:Arc/MetJ-type ribon-helix-helix transcriptional regulator
MELVVNTFKLEKSLNAKMADYIEEHHMSKSDFIRKAIVNYLEDLQDLGAFERTRNDKVYSLAEVERELGLAD